jgi:hypothetical protein
MSLWFTASWRREAHRAAVVGFRLLVKRKQVFVDQHKSRVYDLREDLCRALPGLPDPALVIGEKIVNECTSYLTALRPFIGKGLAPDDDQVGRHRQWVAAVSGDLDALKGTLPTRARKSLS